MNSTCQPKNLLFSKVDCFIKSLSYFLIFADDVKALSPIKSNQHADNSILRGLEHILLALMIHLNNRNHLLTQLLVFHTVKTTVISSSLFGKKHPY